MKSKVLYILKIVSITLLVLALTGYAIFAYVMADKWAKEKHCKAVQVNIHRSNSYNFITTDDVTKELQRQNLYPKGRVTSHMQADSIEKHLQKINVVKNVECYLENDTLIVIDITQREPLFRVITDDGTSYYIDSERTTMRANRTFGIILPLVTGRVTEKMAQGEIYDFIEEFKKDEFWNNHIGQINFRADGTVEFITKIGVKKILIDDLQTWKEKMDIAKKWYEQYPEQAWSDKYIQMDLRFKNLIYCKKGVTDE